MKGRLRYMVCSRHALDGSEGGVDDGPHFVFAMQDSRAAVEMTVVSEFPDSFTATKMAMLWNCLERRRSHETNSWV